jgi:hypothetical protein
MVQQQYTRHLNCQLLPSTAHRRHRHRLDLRLSPACAPTPAIQSRQLRSGRFADILRLLPLQAA